MHTLSHSASTHTHSVYVYSTNLSPASSSAIRKITCRVSALALHLGALKAHVNVEAAQLLFTTAAAATTTTTAQPEDEHDIFVALAPLLI